MFSPCHIKQNQNVSKSMQGLSFDNIVLKELHTNIDRKYQKKWKLPKKCKVLAVLEKGHAWTWFKSISPICFILETLRPRIKLSF